MRSGATRSDQRARKPRESPGGFRYKCGRQKQQLEHRDEGRPQTARELFISVSTREDSRAQAKVNCKGANARAAPAKPLINLRCLGYCVWLCCCVSALRSEAGQEAACTRCRAETIDRAGNRFGYKSKPARNQARVVNTDPSQRTTANLLSALPPIVSGDWRGLS